MTKIAKALAAFDLDGTAYKTSALEALVAKLQQQGMYSRKEIARLDLLRTKWEADNTERLYIDYIEAMVASFLNALKQRKVAKLEEIAESLLTEKSLRKRRFTYQAMQLLEPTYYTVAISGSPQIALEIIAKEMPLDAIYGSRLDSKDGVFTGTGRTINKLEIINYLQKSGSTTLKGSVAFGDTFNDASMLSAVDTAVCVNPSATLELEARHRSWHIVRESRDNVSHVTPDGKYYGVQTTSQILERIGLL